MNDCNLKDGFAFNALLGEQDDLNNIQINQFDVLSLAFVGDAVHSLFCRVIFVRDKDYKQKDLQALTSSIVCAKNQSLTLKVIENSLTENEMAIVKRARNAHNNNRAKNSTAQEYKRSTAFEALKIGRASCRERV